MASMQAAVWPIISYSMIDTRVTSYRADFDSDKDLSFKLVAASGSMMCSASLSTS